ncbi:hypothetical protein C5S36_13920 [Candidatus Methanophagaceae archaeon]|nr:hypothetical protein C5S36_13920 [Methanophagales archaeon]
MSETVQLRDGYANCSDILRYIQFASSLKKKNIGKHPSFKNKRLNN